VVQERLSVQQKNKIRRVAKPGAEQNEAESGELNVVPFLDIITNVMTFVLATITVAFTATIDTTPPRNGPRPPSEPTLGLSVLVVPGGFALKARGGNVAPGCTDSGAGLAVPKKNGDYDYEALRGCAAKLKASGANFKSEKDVTVAANPEVPYQVVVAALDAVRKDEAGDELFPEVKLGVAR
jgi:biopolymer transport protein ExbD